MYLFPSCPPSLFPLPLTQLTNTLTSVAVFDILKSKNPHPSDQSPFVLLQPRPQLHQPPLQPNAHAYVGLVEETGSLFAMSAEQFPLVGFTEDSSGSGPGLLGDDGDGEGGGMRREGKKGTCRNGGSDRRCLTGTRTLEESSTPWRNLLDGVPVPVPPSSPSLAHPPLPALPGPVDMVSDNTSTTGRETESGGANGKFGGVGVRWDGLLGVLMLGVAGWVYWRGNWRGASPSKDVSRKAKVDVGEV